MANDRIFIRCRKCGEQKMLAKYYPTIARYGVDVSDFVSEHLANCIEGAPMYLPDRVFDLLTEAETNG